MLCVSAKKEKKEKDLALYSSILRIMSNTMKQVKPKTAYSCDAFT